MKSLVLITTDQATGDLMSTALGRQDPGASTYSKRLSATGQEPATHYGVRTWAADDFLAALSACIAQTSLPPAPWSAVGLDESQVYAFCAGLIFDVQDNVAEPLAHWQAVIAANGLQQIPDAET